MTDDAKRDELAAALLQSQLNAVEVEKLAFEYLPDQNGIPSAPAAARMLAQVSRLCRHAGLQNPEAAKAGLAVDSTPPGKDQISQDQIDAFKKAYGPFQGEGSERKGQNGRWLDRTEAIEHLEQLPNLGYPMRLESTGRGPKPKKTQYDVAKKARTDKLRRLTAAPAARDKIGDRLGGIINRIAKSAPTDIKPHKLVNFVLGKLIDEGKNADEKTVRRHLQKLGYLKPRNK